MAVRMRWNARSTRRLLASSNGWQSIRALSQCLNVSQSWIVGDGAAFCKGSVSGRPSGGNIVGGRDGEYSLGHRVL